MTVNRVAAMKYLNENLDVLDDYTKLPDDDSRIIKVRELFVGKENKKGTSKKSLQATRDGVTTNHARVSDFARTIQAHDSQVWSAIKNGRRINGYDIRLVDFDENYLTYNGKPFKNGGGKTSSYRLKVTKNGKEKIYDSVTEFCKEAEVVRQRVYESISSGKIHKGYKFEKIAKKSN